MTPDWQGDVVEQLSFWWDTWFWPRVDGLSDDEYFWKPAHGCWSVRPLPGGGFGIDWEMPAPEPPPVTSIAWRLAHLGSGSSPFAMRTTSAARRGT